MISLCLALVLAVEPPVLVEQAAAEYPAEAASAGLEGVVGLLITVDDTGLVTAADVVEPAGHGFDESAQAAAKQLRFTPATDDGKPIAVQFLYRWHFRAPQSVSPPEPAVEQPAPVVDAGTPETKRETRITARSEVKRLKDSAESVTVLDTKTAKKQSADLGELLARNNGVTVRRSGGLGSQATFSLNGLEGDQIRFFLDGVPLDLAGFPFGIANVPVNLVERIELYRGVVPIRFGADALGGAVNLVTPVRRSTGLAASYQVGSFGTHRVSLSGAVELPAGFSVNASGFFDTSRNDYLVDVQVPDETGRLNPARVQRFHDGYVAGGGALEVVATDQRWAKHFSVRGFLSAYDKELQNNPVMTVPYGEARYGELVGGVTARWMQPLSERVDVEVLGSYANKTLQFDDQGRWVYDWYGNKMLERRVPGEIDNLPHDQRLWQHTAFARARLEWRLLEHHAARLSVTPTYSTRIGDERLDTAEGARDPLNARRSLHTVVTGLEHEVEALPFLDGHRVQNVLFAKHYVYGGESGEILPGGGIDPLSWGTMRFGAGDGVRVHVTEWLLVKASYEFATRLPRPDEVFGNGVLIRANLALEPEVSHNANLGPRIDLKSLGLSVEANAFLRDSDRLIVLLGQTKFLQYQNVRRARTLGVEGNVAWTSPGDWLQLTGSITWQDVRNVSSEGTFGAFDGDRVPNRPWLFASWGASYRFRELLGDDVLELFYTGRWVNSFSRTWESIGLTSTKQQIPTQHAHHVGVSWTVRTRAGRYSASAEVQNLADAKLYDVFGVQRPGRAMYLKVTAELP